MSRYTGIEITTNPTSDNRGDKRRYQGVKYPEVPLSVDDIYVYAEEGDRFDILALQYYGDSSLWWIISISNETLPQNSYYLPLGVQIRIPQNVGAIISDYNALNNRIGT
jgi:phage tail protein X